jgi:hypothetical protein
LVRFSSDVKIVLTPASSATRANSCARITPLVLSEGSGLPIGGGTSTSACRTNRTVIILASGKATGTPVSPLSDRVGHFFFDGRVAGPLDRGTAGMIMKSAAIATALSLRAAVLLRSRTRPDKALRAFPHPTGYGCRRPS